MIGNSDNNEARTAAYYVDYLAPTSFLSLTQLFIGVFVAHLVF